MEHLCLPFRDSGWQLITCSLSFPSFPPPPPLLIQFWRSTPGALRPGCPGSGRLGEEHVIVMTGVWDESQYRKHIFIMTLLQMGLSSGESQSPGQAVINFTTASTGGGSLPKARGHFSGYLPGASCSLPAPRAWCQVDRVPGSQPPSKDLSA
jgi:hypothetical protein